MAPTEDGTETITDAEFEVVETTLPAIREKEIEQRQVGGLFNTDDPDEVIEKATRAAGALMKVVRSQHLASNISGKEYLHVEAWTTLGAMVGLSARTEWSRPINGADGKQIGYEAAVEVVNSQGIVIARSEAQCTRSERTWAGRDDYALRSMAQTRAMGKALRMPLGFIAVLAGYEATPMEEMPVASSGNSQTPPAPRSSSNTSPDTGEKKAALLKVLQDRLLARSEPQWQPEAVVEAGNRQWGTSYKTLDDFSAQHLQFVLDALPKP